MPAQALLLITVLLWGFNFTAVRYGVTHGVQPLVYVSLRWTLAGLVLCGVAAWRGRRIFLGRRDILIITVASAFGVVLNQMAFSYSLHLAAASTVALVFGTLPILVSVLSHMAGHERLERRHWVATSVSFAGVALVAVGSQGGLRANGSAILLALVAATTFSIYSVAIVGPMRRHSPLSVNAASCVIGGAILSLVSLLWFGRQTWEAPPPTAWVAVLYSGLGPIVIGNLFWFIAIERVGAGRSSLYANLQPFVGAVFAVIVLTESVHLIQMIGGAVIGAAIAVGGRVRLSAPPAD